MDDPPQQLALLAVDAPARPLVCGLDEVGRGALAGPLVAAAVILPDDFPALLGPLMRFLRDSKTVPAARRDELASVIHAHALAVETVVIAVDQINARGIGWANREAFRRLIARIAADEYIVDGRMRPPAHKERAARVRCLVRADATVPEVSAASIVAKSRRDAIMRTLHSDYPDFGWGQNVGYGTRAHIAALHTHGPSPHHRSVFVATALGLAPKKRATREAQATLVASVVGLSARD
ncbi:MAG: ribonuclease HII [Ktedonobacterales bacterium]